MRDPFTAAPALRRMIREGATDTNGMLPINPTVTWPNHTAMMTGVDATRHGVLYNGLSVLGFFWNSMSRPVRRFLSDTECCRGLNTVATLLRAYRNS